MSSATALSPARVKSELAQPDLDAGVRSVAERIRTRGSATLRVAGRSMYPWIRPKDIVFVRRWDFDRLFPGNVVLFQRNGSLLVHRVIRVVSAKAGDEGTLHVATKGDAVADEDAPVTHAEFLGRVSRIHRKHRHIDMESLSRNALGRVLAGLSPASPLLYPPLRVIKRVFFVVARRTTSGVFLETKSHRADSVVIRGMEMSGRDLEAAAKSEAHSIP
ncbi:MAG: S24/S26 family peptidase [Candidatus Acidiferrales bacterium]